MHVIFFIVECSIARFLCAMRMRVFAVPASSSPLGYTFLPNVVSFAAYVAELPTEKNRVISQSLTHPAYMMPREPKLLLRNRLRINISVFPSNKGLTSLGALILGTRVMLR